MDSEPSIKQFDLLVYGGTEAGIFASVRAARSGMKTALITDSQHVCGFFPSLGAWETHFPGDRAPLSSEVRSRIIDYYRRTYGEDSPELEVCLSLESNNPMVTFEPKVGETILCKILLAEENLHWIRPFQLSKVQSQEQKLIRIEGEIAREPVSLCADYFIDASYNGDLAAAAGANYRLGREDRSEFAEIHAGRIYTRWIQGRYPKEAVEGRLNLLPTWTTSAPQAGSTGEGDDAIQDYSYRICLCSNPENRIIPEKPADYVRSRFAPILLPPEEKAKLELPFHHRWLTTTIEATMAEDHLFHGHALPCQKRSWNATNLTGENKTYPEADAVGRAEIEARHLNHALGLLYFLQNDPEVPAPVQKEARRWGLAKDEFCDSNNLPPVIYIRESRRFEGSYIYQERDCMKHEGLERAPIHADGIAFTEFALDSLPCRPRRNNGSLPDGQFFEKAKSLPGSLPWRCLLPNRFVNLLTPTNPSVTHCAWGTVRQTASLLQLAETCALAVGFAKRNKIDLKQIQPIELQIHLVQNEMMIGFFNDLDMNKPAKWKEAALVFGNYGFFFDYNIRPAETLDRHTAETWITILEGLLENCLQNPNTKAAQLLKSGNENAQTLKPKDNGKPGILTKDSIRKRLADLYKNGRRVNRAQALESMYLVLLEAVGQRAAKLST